MDRHQKYGLYLNAFARSIRAQDTKKIVLYGVKAIGMEPEPKTLVRKEVELSFELSEVIHYMMGILTPSDLENLFPIKKDFDGHKYGCKDYFYTRKILDNLPDKPIGDIGTVMELLWDYVNEDLNDFSVKAFGYMSDLQKLDGHPGIMEEWASENGIKTYTMHTDQKGKRYLVDSDGKAARVKRKVPRYLRLVK